MSPTLTLHHLVTLSSPCILSLVVRVQTMGMAPSYVTQSPTLTQSHPLCLLPSVEGLYCHTFTRGKHKPLEDGDDGGDGDDDGNDGKDEVTVTRTVMMTMTMTVTFFICSLYPEKPPRN